MKKRAIISVSNKEGILEFAKGLCELGWEIVSTGGTARHLKAGGVDVLEVSQVTGFPEILGGRVKTLHPKVHGGILARRDVSADMEELSAHGISPVDMVVCNLYPFVETALKPGVSTSAIMEEIDIGGPTLLRASAKNWPWVIVLCNPKRYREILDILKERGDIDQETRKILAGEAFSHTAAYDAAIASFLGVAWRNWPLDFPDEISLGYRKVFSLRYGENPHQVAAYYEPVIPTDIPSLKGRQLQGKELSFNNINDLDSAYRTVWEFEAPACAIVKHAAPCGVALGSSTREAFERAFEGDPVSAFGGVVAFNREVDEPCARALKRVFLEVVAAPSFTEGAISTLSSKKDLRLLMIPGPSGPIPGSLFNPEPYEVKMAMGGLLIQSRDTLLPSQEEWQVVSKRPPTEKEMEDLRFAMTVCKHVKSNAIVLAKDGATVGIGGGQPNRVDSVRIAISRAKERAEGACLASDAFFPFPDSVEEAAKAKISAIAHPGGSIRDQESIDKADEYGIAMVITGKRHFLH
ncbi:MAG TPA: bifunctional phosphoribosylaminoimidazolecarboxamide formyltransferase/IMP cyclohydrolase [Firmicutes bacterium]|nr:bifunctional phosphoribosylaminoimidazolecarboxamide formyltransferase/IMP cyclohydrolase [Candidatus Fermentithermobacillaceae bacterium]